MLASKVELCEEKLEWFDTTIKGMAEKRRSLMLRLNYVKRKSGDLEATEMEIGNSLVDEMRLLEEKLNILEEENRELSQLGTVLNSPEVIGFQNGRYTDDIRETIIELLQRNVAMRNVGPIIQIIQTLYKLYRQDACC